MKILLKVNKVSVKLEWEVLLVLDPEILKELN